MILNGVYIPHIASVKEEHEKIKQKYPLTFADDRYNDLHAVYYRFSPFPINFVCDIWYCLWNGFKLRKVTSSFNIALENCILSVPEEVEKRFPKHRKNEYLNYVLLTGTDKQEIAEKLAVYAVDILGRRWKEAEDHIFNDKVCSRCGQEHYSDLCVARVLSRLYYETRILETWRRYKWF